MCKGDHKKGLLTLGVLGHLLCLCLFKYNGNWILPLAISFYTFTQIYLLADIYRGEIRQIRPLDHILYLLYFPRLLEGPITRYHEVTDEFHQMEARRFDPDLFLQGLTLFILALAKKVLIYMDFSSYCEMGRGISLMLGMDLPLNFTAPYRTCSIPDYWRNWHITLTRFFTRNIYIPLGGSRKGRFRTYLNIMIIFLCSGLWHGNGWTYVIWGLCHGAASCLVRFCRTWRKNRGLEPSSNRPLVRGLLMGLNYLTIAFFFILFRAEKVGDACTIWKNLLLGSRQFSGAFVENFGMKELTYALHFTPWAYSPYRYDICMWFITIFCLFLVFFCPTVCQMAERFARLASGRDVGVQTGRSSDTVISAQPGISEGRSRRLILGAVLLTLLFAWCIVSLGGVTSFVYFQF